MLIVSKSGLLFTADWCPDCQFIYPVMPEIEASHPDMTFVRVNRDDYMALAQRGIFLVSQVLS